MSELTDALINWAFLFGLIALIFFIWQSFSRLTRRHRKEKWLYSPLGISIFFTGVYMGSLIEPSLKNYIISGTLRLPFGIIACLSVYKFLDKSGIKKTRIKPEKS